MMHGGLNGKCCRYYSTIFSAQINTYAVGLDKFSALKVITEPLSLFCRVLYCWMGTICYCFGDTAGNMGSPRICLPEM